jgi:hypothetical protein
LFAGYEGTGSQSRTVFSVPHPIAMHLGYTIAALRLYNSVAVKFQVFAFAIWESGINLG